MGKHWRQWSTWIQTSIRRRMVMLCFGTAWRDLGTGVQSEIPRRGKHDAMVGPCFRAFLTSATARREFSFPTKLEAGSCCTEQASARNKRLLSLLAPRGDLKRESVSAALHSCYPDLVIGKRRTAVALAEETTEDMTDQLDHLGRRVLRR